MLKYMNIIKIAILVFIALFVLSLWSFLAISDRKLSSLSASDIIDTIKTVPQFTLSLIGFKGSV